MGRYTCEFKSAWSCRSRREGERGKGTRKRVEADTPSLPALLFALFSQYNEIIFTGEKLGAGSFGVVLKVS